MDRGRDTSSRHLRNRFRKARCRLLLRRPSRHCRRAPRLLLRRSLRRRCQLGSVNRRPKFLRPRSLRSRRLPRLSPPRPRSFPRSLNLPLRCHQRRAIRSLRNQRPRSRCPRCPCGQPRRSPRTRSAARRLPALRPELRGSGRRNAAVPISRSRPLEPGLYVRAKAART